MVGMAKTLRDETEDVLRATYETTTVGRERMAGNRQDIAVVTEESYGEAISHLMAVCEALEATTLRLASEIDCLRRQRRRP